MSRQTPQEKPGNGLYHAPAWNLGRLVLQPRHRPLVMGVVNLTPDSFYPSSRYPEPQAAVGAALELIADGAEIIDLGAESSRPGSKRVGGETERQRLLPVVRELRGQTQIPISVDTYRSRTARDALDVGADIVNDISAGTFDSELLPLVATRNCGLVLMHMRGSPENMQDNPQYERVVEEVATYLADRARHAEDLGIAADRIVIDPGIGFGKDLQDNLLLMARLQKIGNGRPVLLGASRKSFIEHLTGAPVSERIGGSLAALHAAYQAQVSVVRVHDVAASVQFYKTLAAIDTARSTEG